jgi:hypothetical protein
VNDSHGITDGLQQVCRDIRQLTAGVLVLTGRLRPRRDCRRAHPCEFPGSLRGRRPGVRRFIKLQQPGRLVAGV